MTINYNDLYFSEEVVIKYDNKEVGLDIQLRGIADNKPDCKIGHFGYNFYFRTPHALKYKAYKSVTSMKKAVERVLKTNGLQVVGWREK